MQIGHLGPLGHEGAAVMKGISALIKDPTELPDPFPLVNIQGEVSDLEEGLYLSNHAGTMIWVLEVPQNCEK